MAAWMREEEKKTFGNRQRKKEAEEGDKVDVAGGVTVRSLKHFRAALIGSTKDSQSGDNLIVRCAESKA